MARARRTEGGGTAWGGLRIVSGGQTGADRAGLDVALELGVPCGGACPAGRLAEDGRIPARYPLEETGSPDYQVRTEANVSASSGTVVFSFGRLEGGSRLTAGLCRKHRRPCLHLDGETLPPEEAAGLLADFVGEGMAVSGGRYVLNVAGQRASREPRVHGFARDVLRRALGILRPGPGA